jgi:phosphohistidine phosphatase
MRLYIVRHGEAEPQAATDAERPLTALGASQVRALWTRLHASQPEPARIVSSPLRRAQETARIVAGIWEDAPTVVEQSLLRPETAVEQTLDWLGGEPDLDRWVLVSHMPLVALLTGRLVEGPGTRYPFAVGAVACLEVEVACLAGSRLLWLESPQG